MIDPCLSLSYLPTPVKCRFSPSELLMSRKLRTNIPMTRELRKPSTPDRTLLTEREEQYRTQLRGNYDHHNQVREIKPLDFGARVWIADHSEEAHVVQEAGTRSYEIQTSDGNYRQNHRVLVNLPASVISDLNNSDMTIEIEPIPPIGPILHIIHCIEATERDILPIGCSKLELRTCMTEYYACIMTHYCIVSSIYMYVCI